MARLPEIKAKELIQNTGVIKPGNTGEGLAALGSAAASVGARLNEEDERAKLAAERAYVAGVEVDNREKLAQIYASTNGDPERFNILAKAHIQGVVEVLPEHLRPKVEPSLKSTAVGFYNQGLGVQVARARTVQQDALIANENHYANTWMALSDLGLGGTPQAQDAMRKYMEALDGSVINQFRSKEHAAAKLSEKQDEATARTILAFNRSTFASKGFGAAWQELNDNLGDKSPVRNIAVRNKLLNQGQEYLREQVAAQGRVDAIAERDIKKAEDEAGKLMYELEGGGKLTQEWLMQNKRHLSKADFAHGMKALTRPDAVKDNLSVFDDLERRDRLGEDITPDVLRAEDAGYLKNETARTLIRQNRARLASSGPKDPYTISEDYLKTYFAVNSLRDDPGGRARKANALDMFRNLVSEENKRREAEGKPRLNDKEIFDIRDEVKERFQFLNFDETTIGLERPKYFQGTRTNPNLDATEQAVVSAYESGALTKQQMLYEIKVIQKWRAAMELRPKKEPKKQ